MHPIPKIKQRNSAFIRDRVRSSKFSVARARGRRATCMRYAARVPRTRDDRAAAPRRAQSFCNCAIARVDVDVNVSVERIHIHVHTHAHKILCAMMWIVESAFEALC